MAAKGKWSRKMEAIFRTAIERAQAVTASEYANAIAAAITAKTGYSVSGEDIEDETPIQNYVSEMEAFDIDGFLAAVDWSALADKWERKWVGAYGVGS